MTPLAVMVSGSFLTLFSIHAGTVNARPRPATEGVLVAVVIGSIFTQLPPSLVATCDDAGRVAVDEIFPLVFSIHAGTVNARPRPVTTAVSALPDALTPFGSESVLLFARLLTLLSALPICSRLFVFVEVMPRVRDAEGVEDAGCRGLDPSLFLPKLVVFVGAFRVLVDDISSSRFPIHAGTVNARPRPATTAVSALPDALTPFGSESVLLFARFLTLIGAPNPLVFVSLVSSSRDRFMAVAVLAVSLALSLDTFISCWL